MKVKNETKPKEYTAEEIAKMSSEEQYENMVGEYEIDSDRQNENFMAARDLSGYLTEDEILKLENTASKLGLSIEKQRIVLDRNNLWNCFKGIGDDELDRGFYMGIRSEGGQVILYCLVNKPLLSSKQVIVNIPGYSGKDEDHFVYGGVRVPCEMKAVKSEKDEKEYIESLAKVISKAGLADRLIKYNNDYEEWYIREVLDKSDLEQLPDYDWKKNSALLDFYNDYLRPQNVPRVSIPENY